MNPFMNGHDIFEQMHRVITGSFHISVLNIIKMSQKFKTHFFPIYCLCSESKFLLKTTLHVLKIWWITYSHDNNERFKEPKQFFLSNFTLSVNHKLAHLGLRSIYYCFNHILYRNE